MFSGRLFLFELFTSNFVAAILKMANLTRTGPYFGLETVIFAFYGKFPIRIRMSPYSTHDVLLDHFIGLVSKMESRLICLNELTFQYLNPLHSRGLIFWIT